MIGKILRAGGLVVALLVFFTGCLPDAYTYSVDSSYLTPGTSVRVGRID